MTFDEMEAALRARLGPPARGSRRGDPRPPLPDFDRVDQIGEFWGHPETRTFGSS